jgi:putative PEP-CTERM system histidine kinase
LNREVGPIVAVRLPAMRLPMVGKLEALRWQLGRVVGLTRRHRTYDYRAHWISFTRRMSRIQDAGEIARELAEQVTQATGAGSAAVYLLEGDEPVYRLSASTGTARFVPSLEPAGAVPSWFRAADSSALLPAGLLPSVTIPTMPEARGIAIRWRTMLLGFIVLGPRRFGADYAAEDLELLVTVTAQAAAAIAAARLPKVAVEPTRIQTLDRFTATVIHDLKNSVSALSLLTRNAAGNFADPEFQRDAISTLSRTVERMRRLLVKLSSPDTPAPASRTEAIDLEELIIEATTPLATDARVRLVRQLRPVHTVYGDREALLRVLENLTTNAAEAIDREGTVTVTLAEEQGRAVISVADTGCGISEEYRARHLFSPFRSTKQGGWGLGLYQTKQVIENQYGEILVESVEGHGTTFTVKLPLRADHVESLSLESAR